MCMGGVAGRFRLNSDWMRQQRVDSQNAFPSRPDALSLIAYRLGKRGETQHASAEGAQGGS
jgi:hypothetical protein